jgi:transposase-like protein
MNVDDVKRTYKSIIARKKIKNHIPEEVKKEILKGISENKYTIKEAARVFGISNKSVETIVRKDRMVRESIKFTDEKVSD